MKAKIVIASTLKPVIDPRAYEKIGKSLAQTKKYDIHIIGSFPSLEEGIANLTLYPLLDNIKNSFSRFFAPWKVLSKIQTLKPDLLIVGTHELLLIGLLYKLVHSAKLVYDIRENYYYNLIYQRNYPRYIKHFLAVYVRSKERFTSLFIDHFILAERCYQKELNFLSGRFTVIENKYKPNHKLVENTKQSIPELLLSGTISEPYGVFDAITFFSRLPANEVKLVIVGHCPNRKTLLRLRKEVEGQRNIELDVSDSPISQARIDAKIGDKTIGLLPYKKNKSTQNKIPTKLYEYVGRGIPILISHNPVWSKILNEHKAGKSIDFLAVSKIDSLDIINRLTNLGYPIDLKDIIWKTEENRLLATIDTLLLAK